MVFNHYHDLCFFVVLKKDLPVMLQVVCTWIVGIHIDAWFGPVAQYLCKSSLGYCVHSWNSADHLPRTKFTPSYGKSKFNTES